ncbi:hypothetical protein JNUCC0626_32725 [Lentzea sp. JNUCC 0626]|uniref:hypothetical protein n=1 Tax=Lentzea sp. JNUCC 0626 TaxID=3367513 RepID=UPI0037495B5B
MNTALVLATCLLLAIAFGGFALLLVLACRGADPELRPEILRALGAYVAQGFAALAEVPARLIHAIDVLSRRKQAAMPSNEPENPETSDESAVQ